VIGRLSALHKTYIKFKNYMHQELISSWPMGHSVYKCKTCEATVEVPFHVILTHRTNSVALSPRANYTDWATAIYRRNLVPTFVDRGVPRGQRGGSPTAVNLSFLDQLTHRTQHKIAIVWTLSWNQMSCT
jgi:hypothetical protein